MTTSGSSAAAVRVSGVSKRYPGTVALDGVDLEIRPGEIHALMGGNGSGKSTLIKILCGVVPPERGGSIEIDGHRVPAADWSRETARAAGVHAVHQDLGVFLDLSVAENLTLGEGFARHRLGGIAWSEIHARAAALIRRYRIDAEPQTPMRSLSQANRTLVAIARALQHGTHDRGLLILDEPTAALPTAEADLLLGTLERFAGAGQAILYVSHRLDEIMRIADRVTVFRDGRSAGTFAAADLDEATLVRLIVGADLTVPTVRPRRERAEVPALELKKVSVGPLRDVDLTVEPGEIVGLAGLVGSGRSSLLRSIFGVHPIASGSVLLNGRPVRSAGCRDAIASGVAYVPENRADDAAFAHLSIAANIVTPRIPAYWSLRGMRDGAIRTDARALMRSFIVRAASSEAPLSTLSGGNQQKVVLARWLGMAPRVLLLDEPTQGVDVGARSEIHALIRRAADDGLAVLMAASDPEEMAVVVDRAVVIRGGRIDLHLTRNELTAARLTTEIHRERTEAA